MKLSLVVLSAGKLEGKTLDINLAQFVIGRDPQCHLRPNSPLISKRHCALIQREGKAFIRDFDSTNGSFLNDEPLKGETELRNGDRLKIGPLLFEVRIEQTAAAVNRPTPPPPTRSATPTKTAPASQTPAPPAAKKPAAAAPGSVAKKPAAPAAPGSEAARKPAAAAPARPAPAPAAKSDAGESEGDDDIAAMLLSLQDDSSAGLSLSGSDVPEGSTVHEMTVPPEVAQKLNENAAAKEKEKEKPKNSGNTSNAAKSILEMYMKRPRT
jgi:predicted component of type VI protein secretion system